MPTTPQQDLLPPIDPTIKGHLESFGRLVDEVIAFGTHVLDWHMQAAKGGDELAPVTLTIRHILELLVSISSSLKTSSIDPCKILLRALLESLLGLAYIVKEDSVRRGFAFLAVEAHQRLKHYKALVPTSPENAQLRKSLEGDTVAPGFEANISGTVLQNSIDATNRFLATPGAKLASAELRNRKLKVKNPNWYSLYGGPSNLEGLAASVGYQSLYQFFYRYWSRSTHGIDIIQGKLSTGPSGRAAVYQLLLPTEAETVTQIAVTLSIKMFTLVIDKYTPNRRDEFREWYVGDVRPLFMTLGNNAFIKVAYPNGGAPA